MKGHFVAASIAVLIAGAAALASPPVEGVSPDGTVHVGAFDLPFSNLASDAAKAEFAGRRGAPPPTISLPADAPIERHRAEMDAYFQPKIDAAYRRYPVNMKVETIGGIYTQVFTPKGGVAPENARRVLINLHGGGFYIGARTSSQIESVPIAAVARIKVISVDYRMAPEHHFPAASQDVAAVYRALLRTYRPQDIGIYGCSAGGQLTGQVLAWFQKENLPNPAAAGIFCAATVPLTMGGDSRVITGRTGGMLPTTMGGLRFIGSYTQGHDPRDPLISPSTSRTVLAKFPPTLFVTSTRAGEMSAAARSVLDLQLAGVDAPLLAWDGLDHGFLYNVDLPESQEAYTLISAFFMKHFGSARAAR